MKAELEMFRLKRGVSLIMVLMFMLVATIAATATWKWITSEGKSSASRMLQNEAYQSSIAGIEHARAWMTFNANETGALLRQYLYKNDGTRRKVAERLPINMDAQVRSFDNGAKQDHHVWLMEANIDTIPYKVKILSEGISRNGQSRHTEVAIFNISGLYQVLTDTTHIETHIPINFEYAYFGGSYNGAGGLSITSAVVNGNWQGNPQSLTGNFIVTGNAVLDGNDATVGPLMCVGGSAKLGNQGITAQDVYIDEDVSPLKGNITGDAYFGGSASQSNTGAIEIGGSVTVDGTFFSNQATSDYYTHISGNLCMGENGVIVSSGEKSAFQVDADVWMPGDLNLWFGSAKGSSCYCFKNACVYNKCRCNGTDCKEGTAGAVCEEAIYNGECNDGDWLSHYTLTKNPADESRRWYKLKKASRRVACDGPAHEIVGCDNYSLYADKDNYAIASKSPADCPTGAGSDGDCGKFILGNSNKSKAYIKSYKESSYYNSGLVAKVYHETGARNCKGGTCTAIGDRDLWNGEYYHPYGAEKEADNKLYFMYFMPEGMEDVSFGSYTDTYWNKTLNGYFVNWGAETEDYTFTTSYHTKDGTHNSFVDAATAISGTNKYYRLLNYTSSTLEPALKNKMTGTPYCKLATGKNWRPQCGVNSWFWSEGTVSNSMNISNKPACAEDVKHACDEYWEKKTGCDGAKYLVKDPIVTAKAKFEPYADYGCAKGIKTYNSDLVSQLNACYKRNKDNHLTDSLYNGFLVVKVSGGSTSTNPGGKLQGKFIVIAEEPLYTSFMDTEDDSYVFYYMEKGINTLNDATRKNTFIYSEGHIGYGNQFKLTGSIYVTAASCEGMDKLQGSSLTYDPNVTQVLSNACVICSNDGTVCGSKCDGNNGGGDPINPDNPEDDITTAADSIIDPYFISNAPQLNVTIETQYQSSEKTPSSDEDLNPSFIVLPRIVHLCEDASGKLADYFNVVPLNGADVKKSDANIQCSPSLNVNTNLVSDGNTLAEDVYKCTATPTNYSRVPFYVWVYGSCALNPAVRFEFSHIDLVENENFAIRVLVPPEGVTVAATCPPAPSAAWSVTKAPQFTGESNGICTFSFPGTGSSEYKTMYTVRVSEKVTEGMAFTLQIRDGYRLEEPWTTTVGMSDVCMLDRDPAHAAEIDHFCSMNPDKCPPEEYRSYWKDCPNDDADVIWVAPDWTHGYTVGAPPNDYWNIMGHNATLRLKEVPGTSCIVIVPSDTNSKGPPIPENTTEDCHYTLRASGKTGWHNVKLQFVGDIESGKNPFVYYNAEDFSKKCSYDAEDHSCTYPVFDGSKVRLSIDKDDAENKGFSYWKCTGASCPTTDAVGSADFGTEGFTVDDDNTIIEIHFGEQDKHCFFDEFRRGVVACDVAGLDTAQYCIDDCMTHSTNDKICTGANDDKGVFKKTKWHLLSGTLEDIATSQYPSYISVKNTVSESGSDTGVTVISTAQAGYHGTLRALMQVPHQKSKLGRSSKRIRHSGFMLRSNEIGDDFLMLNVYENMSGHLEAQVCSNISCQEPQELKDTVYPYSPLSLSTSSLVMLSATLAGEDTLVLSAFLGDYYYGSRYAGPTRYKTLFKLSVSHTHASETYSYVGFKMADKDFKLYGIGWRSEDFNSECFDGPPMVTCSYAAVAVDGIVETDKLTKPWVGYSGWFDNKKCIVEYWYYNGSDVDGCPASDASNKCGSDGYTFKSGEEAGQHGYIDNVSHKDIKTAKVAMKCGHDANSVYAWSESADHTHCGPFWTGEYTECKTDIANLLGETVSLIANEENRSFMFGESKNLRGESLTIELRNVTENDVELEIALLSKNSDWGSLEVVSRSITVSGHTQKIVSPVLDVVSSFASNTTTGFDPEHVVGMLFTNHSSVGVDVVNISAVCKNSIHCGDNCCSVDLVGESTWQVKFSGEGQNMSKVGSIDISVDIEGSSAPSLSKTANCSEAGGCYTINIPDANIFANKGKTYQFNAKLNTSEAGHPELDDLVSCGSQTPSGITCTPKTIADIYSGDPWPLFEVTLNNCPSTKCNFNVTMGKSSPTEYDVVTGVSQESGLYQSKYEGEPIECNDDAGCQYTYLLESTETDKPFSCKQTFKVKKKNTPVDLSLTCSLENQTGMSVNTTMTTSGSVTATGCDEGCTWSISDGSSEVGNGTYGVTPYSFTGATTAGTVNYVFTVKRASDNAEQSCPAFSVEYVGGGSGVSAVCSVTGENGETDLYQGQKIKLNVSSLSGITQNVQMKWTFNGAENTIDCGTSGCWNNVINAPTTTGTYSYSLSYNGNAVSGCSGNVTISPVLTCSVSPTTVEQYGDYTLTATRNINCGNCSYVYDSGTQNNINFPDGNNTMNLTKTALVKGEKDLTFSCSCNNNFTGTCSEKVTVTESSTPVLSIGNSGTLVSAGTHEIACSGGGQLICWRTGDEFNFTLAGNNCKAYTAEGHGSCGEGTCKSSKQTIVTSKDMYCKGGW